MKSTLLVFFLLVNLSFFAICHAQTSSQTARVDSLFLEWNKPGKPGAAVGIVHQGKLIYAKGFGEADLETGALNGPETVFHIASVSKQFTAYAIVLLAQEGKIALDDSIQKFLPEVPNFGKTITIRHLIHHTSGLRDQWNLLAMAGWRLDDVITKEQVFNLVKRQKDLNFEPGSAYAYCNTGYTLLAEIVARVSKQTFPEYMQEKVFKPLGMKKSLFYDDHEQIVKGRAYSFHQSADGASNPYSKIVLSYANVGATSLFTTITDLAKWVGNFSSAKIGSPATMKQMLDRGRLTKGDTLPYAFGILHGNYKSLPYYGHNGADAGFRSALMYFPGEDYGFIVLSNQAEFRPDAKALEMADIIMAPYFKEQKSEKITKAPVQTEGYKFDSTLFRNYAGAYELAEAPGFILKFRREGQRYFTHPTGQGEVEIFPSSDSTFFLKVVEASVLFHREKQGNVKRITFSQNGDHPGKRVEPGQEEKVAQGQFVGKYYSPELETVYSIRENAGVLQLVHVHHGEVDLKVVNKDRLQAPWWFIQNMDIIRDKGGNVSGMKVSNGRVTNLWFKRLDDDFDAPAVLR